MRVQTGGNQRREIAVTASQLAGVPCYLSMNSPRALRNKTVNIAYLRQQPQAYPTTATVDFPCRHPMAQSAAPRAEAFPRDCPSLRAPRRLIFLLSLCGGLLLTSHAPRAPPRPRAVTRTQLVCRQPYIRMGAGLGQSRAAACRSLPVAGQCPPRRRRSRGAAPSNAEAAADAVAPAPTQQTQTEQPPPPKQPASKPKIQPVTLTSQGAGHVNGLVLIIYTGGTLGMSKDPTTGALEPKPGYLREVVSTMPSSKADMPDTDMIEYDPLLDSSNIGPADWSYLAELVGEHYFDYDGFVIVHGTDTMAYTGAAAHSCCRASASCGAHRLDHPDVRGVQRRAAQPDHLGHVRRALDLSEVAIFFNDVLLRAPRDEGRLVGPRRLRLAQLPAARDGRRDDPDGARSGGRPERLRVHSKLDTKVMVVRLSPGSTTARSRRSCVARPTCAASCSRCTARATGRRTRTPSCRRSATRRAAASSWSPSRSARRGQSRRCEVGRHSSSSASSRRAT